MKEETKKLIERAERRASRATKGPWVRWKGNSSVEQGPAKENTPGCFRGIRNGIRIAECEDDLGSRLQAKRNATFIAGARSDIPKLCSALRDLDAEHEAFKRDVTAYLRALSAYNERRGGSHEEVLAAYVKVIATTGDPFAN